MLYVYDFFEHHKEKIKEEDLQSLKPFGIEDCYIAETDDIIVGDKKPQISPLHDFIYNMVYFDSGEVLELDVMLLDKKLEIPKERAIELLCDDIRCDGDYGYNERILNAENPVEEIEKITKELASVIVGMVIDNLNDEYKRIEDGNFEWV